MNIIRRVLSLLSARSGGRAGGAPARGRGVSRRRGGQASAKRTGVAALLGMLRRR